MRKSLGLRKVEFSSSANEAAAALQATDVAQPIKTFADHVTEIHHLVSLPVTFTYVSLFGERKLALWTQAVVTTKHVVDYQSETAQREVNAEVERLWAAFNADEKSIESQRKEVDRRLESICEVKEASESLQALLRSGVSAIWTALEYLASDLWIIAVNSRPKVLGLRAINQIPNKSNPEELSPRTIPFRILAERDFDLRSCLGTVLKSAFDFTRVEGIQKAYKILFDKDEVMQCLGDNGLKELQVHRNLLVHRAGIVDHAFKALVKTPAKVGERILYDGSEVCKLADAAIHSGAKLATLVAKWLANNPEGSK